MTCKELKAWLDANQVQFNTRMLQDELVKLATQAYALITKE
jgi:arsenate reductase-like glutaredoxin family protein